MELEKLNRYSRAPTKSVYEHPKLIVFGNQHPTVLSRDLHKTRPGDMRVSEFALRISGSPGRATALTCWAKAY
jgi:hypothetical protein